MFFEGHHSSIFSFTAAWLTLGGLVFIASLGVYFGFVLERLWLVWASLGLCVFAGVVFLGFSFAGAPTDPSALGVDAVKARVVDKGPSERSLKELKRDADSKKEKALKRQDDPSAKREMDQSQKALQRIFRQEEKLNRKKEKR